MSSETEAFNIHDSCWQNEEKGMRRNWVKTIASNIVPPFWK